MITGSEARGLGFALAVVCAVLLILSGVPLAIGLITEGPSKLWDIIVAEWYSDEKQVTLLCLLFIISLFGLIWGMWEAREYD